MTRTISAHNAATMQIEGNVTPVEPPSQKLGPYRIKELLGRGAMGEVFLALHVNLDRNVALKVLPASLVANCRSVERFQQEMKAVGRLDHPNVVRAFDADEYEGQHYIAMEYAEGRDLQQVLNEIGQQPVGVACELIAQAAAGLQHVHENNLVHRDIKPSNLMLTNEGIVKILDLGIAKLCDIQNGAITQVGTYFGTPDYISPEQIATTADVDIRSDIYSLGCTAYQLLTGIPPYGDSEYETHHAKLIGHTKGSPLPVHKRLQGCPKGLSRVISRMMAVRPEDRYQQPIEVVNALQEWVETNNSEHRPIKQTSGAKPKQFQMQLAAEDKLKFAGIVGGLALLTVSIIFAMAFLLPKEPASSPENTQSAGVPTPSVSLATGVAEMESGVRGIEANTGELRDTLLRIESSMKTMGGVSKDTAKSAALSGTYRVEGTEPDGETYTGTAMIIKKGDHYDVQWWYGTDSENGRGILQGNTLTVHWGASTPAIYELKADGRLDGSFDRGKGYESLIPDSL